MGRNPRDHGGGRKKGTPNKSTKALMDRAAELGIDPFDALLYIVANNEKALGYNGPQIKVLPTGGTLEIPWITPEMRLKAASEACQYLYPKRKAIEHSGLEDMVNAQATVTVAAVKAAMAKDPAMSDDDDTPPDAA